MIPERKKWEIVDTFITQAKAGRWVKVYVINTDWCFWGIPFALEDGDYVYRIGEQCLDENGHPWSNTFNVEYKIIDGELKWEFIE